MAVSAEIRLSIYNEALRHLGSRRLGALTENREPRRVLDDIWTGGVARYCLEQGEWNFAIRAVHGIYNPSVTPDFGFARAFDQPSDFVRLAAIASDPRFENTLTSKEYTDEAGFWFCDLDEIYVRFVSSGEQYGMDGARWPMVFRRFVAAQMAWEGCERITNSTAKRAEIDKMLEASRKDSRSKDAMNEGVKFPPPGSWVRARHGTVSR